jgi:hypothetical protein
LQQISKGGTAPDIGEFEDIRKRRIQRERQVHIMNRTTAYWVHLANREWGTIRDRASENRNIRVLESEANTEIPLSVDREKWVNNLVRVIERQEEYCFVERPEEFEYIHRCLEKLSMPLAYSPLGPETLGAGERFSERRVA